MATSADGKTLPYCGVLEELVKSADWCIKLAAVITSRKTAPTTTEAATMQDVWNRILSHKNCAACNSEGPAAFPKVRMARIVLSPKILKGRKR